MIEEIILNYLNSGVLTVQAFTERPADPPASFCVIERTGGGIENHIKHASIAIQSFGSTLYEAAVLSEQVIDAMQDAVMIDAVSSVRCSANYNFTDEIRKNYRYQSVFEITYY